ncbi:glycosyltransferase involved in cell wall biosynthesis [Winogradskyella wandonensis]|uniref:Glycosyltransferase involved in cell wall biosynthesis n=1 Tax=Winogradskyella wandonensis TaxID=1442586 RepID=A0A4R1KWU3_9FLAO|nr:glycosyltransferase family 4 protein [Winogradskyella wandonensis]TCK68819.1 glycosyltransferase involved in cell wall biosynthesis [Winogradskyella wandonensis]
MNIAIFSPSKNPYSETFIQAHKNNLKGDVFYYYGSKGHMQLEGVNRLVSKLSLLRFRIIRKLRKHPFSYIREQSVLASLKKNSIAVVLVEYGTHAYNLQSLLKSSGLPVIVHFHGYDASVKTVIEQCNFYKEVFQIATKVVAVSKKMEHILLEMGCPENKLVYNVYGPDSKFETVQPKFTKKQFIGIGRFTDKKAPYYTVMAFKGVIKKHPDAKLLLAGDGSLLNMCQNLVSYYGLEKHVEFLGVIKPDLYRKILSESIAFVQHSITALNGDMEGTPVAILEASMAGIPIISTNHAGISDVVVHNKTGLLGEEHDVERMSKHMLKLLDDEDYAKEMGAAGKAHALENFSMMRHIQTLQNILECATKDFRL